MARYKDYDYRQTKLLPVSFSEQILPGTFEYTLNYLIDHEVDLSVFEGRYDNDETGAPAYDPAILLKIILYAYSRGVISSREIERLCRENVVMMALSADAQPHFTTIADFVSSLGEEIVGLFRDVLLICDEAGLIGREMFAIDGVKLPSNAAKEWSGTRADFAKKVAKMERAVRYLLRKHRALDAQGTAPPPPQREREKQQIRTLRSKVKRLRRWLAENEDKPGKTGKPKKSNLTDNESAKMKTTHGVIQGYDGVAAVDAKHQVVVHAEAFGEAQEHELLAPMIEATREHFAALGEREDIFKKTKLAADSGFHTEANMQKLFEEGIDGYVADILYRKRDPRFATADRYKVRHREERRQQTGARLLFRPADFTYDEKRRICICPAGKRLYKNGAHVTIGGLTGVKFTAPKSACAPCELRAQCLRHPEKTPVRQVVFFRGRTQGSGGETFTAKMKRKIDSARGRYLYGLRLATAEPVFAHIRATKRLNRFTLRGKRKVDLQWKLYCLVHNIAKIHRYGPGFT